MEFSLIPDTASTFEDNWGMSAFFGDPNDNFESIVSPRAAMLLIQDLGIRPAPSAFAPPATKTFVIPPARENGAPIRRPETQEDWESKKETIRDLYLDENLPLKDLMSIMSSKYAFSATERMYKRQFLKWSWKKYNTKGRQHSHMNGGLLETRCGKPTCRRPKRRRVIRSDNQAQNSSWCGLSLPTLMIFSSQCQRWTEELYISLRDLIHGSARQSPVWRNCSKFDWFADDHDLDGQFRLACSLLKGKDFQQYGVVLRQAFRTVDIIIEMESCSVVQPLLLDVPWRLFTGEMNEELQVYLLYVFQMLSTKKPGEPIAAMAKTMHSIFLESPDQFLHSLCQLHGVTADCFIATRGSDDLAGLYAQMEALQVANQDGIPVPATKIIIDGFGDLLNDAIDVFGEDSKVATRMERNRLRAMWYLDYFEDFENSCKRSIRRIQGRNGVHWDDWDSSDLYFVACTLHDLAKFHLNKANFDASILLLKECVRMFDYVVENRGYIWSCGALAAEHRMDLIQVLSELGRLEEASEVRLDMAGSRYLREAVENDSECSSFEI
ncbi:hypothetical protein LX32DRAFT_633771 [Colletotrichum zoysiae]|uniref:Clr5 domain-containing protein n=1 Tax=Colletotrichum zoysiae TaxID=1216348 RepID=A0AAD9HTB7_9PEZI|nr:hypothetical protein LX32DRAFT_633771 [Colletotrichum zoysiae]